MSVPVGLDGGDRAFELAQDDRVAGRGMRGFIRQLQDPGRREARR